MSKNEETITDTNNLFSDISYICNSTKLIVDSLRKGMDIAQLPNGDVIVTEIKTVNTQYTWDKEKNKMTKLAQL
jgi:hypothetical protein